MNNQKQFPRVPQQSIQKPFQKSQSITPEYQRLGIKPQPFVQSAPFVGQVQNIPKNPPTVERYAESQTTRMPQTFAATNLQELEQEENEINHSDIEEAVVGGLMSYKVEPYSFIISYQGEILAIAASQEEAEEYLDKLIFQNQNQDQNQVNVEKIDIWQKLPPPKVGVCLRK